MVIIFLCCIVQIFLHIMTARNGISESELLNLVPVAWYDWLMLFSALQHSGITVTRMGLVSFANEQVSKTELTLKIRNRVRTESSNLEKVFKFAQQFSRLGKSL